MRAEHAADAGVSLEIRAHGAGRGRMATSYTTRGLAALGQPEIVFTWVGPPWLPSPSPAVEAALRAVVRRIVGGAVHLGVDRCVELAEVAAIDIGMAGLLFVPAQAVGDFVPTAGALHGIAVTAAELELATVSPRRLALRLGLQATYFPYPPWTSARRSVAIEGERSVLRSAIKVAVPGLWVDIERGTLTIRVPVASAPLLRRVIEAAGERGIVTLAAPAPDADAQLVWMPGRAVATMFMGPRSRAARVGGGFLSLALGPRLTIGVVEDGFALTLDRASRDAFVAALSRGAEWQATSPEGRLRVRTVGQADVDRGAG